MADTALEQLADISEPALQLSFALAPLWWLLAAFILAAIIYLLLRAYSRRRYFAMNSVMPWAFWMNMHYLHLLPQRNVSGQI